MRIAYHPNGSSMTTYQLRQWVNSAKSNPSAPPSILITVSHPTYPYDFGLSVMADDRKTVGGDDYSRILSARRRGQMTFGISDATENELWKAWHSATLGGRVPYLLEEPLTNEWIAVTSAVSGAASTKEYFAFFRPKSLEINEWL